MALLPKLLSAIMGSGANKNFDPNNPTSMPFEEAKSGLGRFARRYGTGVDAAAINNEYAAKRGEEDRGYGFRSQLLDKEQGFRAGMFDKEQAATKERDAARAAEEWRQLHSRLTNQAEMQNSQNAFQSRLFNAREAGDQQQRNWADAQENYRLTGSWNPAEQQEILSQIRTQRMNEPMPLGSGSFYDRRTQRVHSRVPATGMSVDPNTGELISPRPESWRSWDPMSANAEESVPSAAAPAGGGRSLGNPEEIRAALGVRETGAAPTSTNAPPASLMDRTRRWIDGQLPGGITNMNTLPDRTEELKSKFLKFLGITNQNQGMLNKGLEGNLLQ